MTLIHIGTRRVVTASTTDTVAELARSMAEKDVGSIVILRAGKPVGIVTDRDLVVRVMSPGLDVHSVTAEEVMSQPLESVSVDRQPLAAAVHMRERGIRRLPIVGPKGELLGIVTHDDLVYHLSSSESELADALGYVPAPRLGG